MEARRRIHTAYAALAGLATLALTAVVLHSTAGVAVSLEGQTYTYTAAVPAEPSPDQVYTYATSTPGENTYSYSTSVLGDNTYTYSTAVAPTDQTFTYNTQMAAKPDAYTYSTAVEPQDNTYTYLAGPQAAGQEEFTYSTNAGGPALYTYNAAPEAGGLTTFNAQEVGAQGSVINGYVEGDKPELWYNVPIGEIHPLDTAGRWDSGQVTSINPDSTTRASAPLTLTGERADGTVASEDSTRPPAEDRLRAGGAATTKLLELPELMQLSRRQRVRSVKFNAQALAKKMHVSQARLRRIYSTPVSGVGRLSAEERKLWANHVILAAKKKQLRHMVDRTPVSKVKELPKKEQMEWAKHVLKRSKLRWAQSASRLVRNELHPAAKAGSAPHLRDKHHISVEPLPARGKAGKVDTFGMPELRGPWSGGLLPQSAGEMARELRSDRPCGLACHQRAVAAARSMLPVSDEGLSGLADDGILPRMPVS